MRARHRRIARSVAGGICATALLTVGVQYKKGPPTSLPDAVLKAVIEPQLLSQVPAELQWCIMPERTAYAASRVEQLHQRAIDRRTTDADRAPVRTIFDDKPTYSAVAVDPIRDEVVLQDENLFQILVYGRGQNTPATAQASEPRRRIGGVSTKIEFNCGLYVDPATGDIYSVPNDTVDTLVIFSRKASGDVKPDRELSTPHGTYGIAVDEKNQELFLTVQHTNSIVVYRKMAEGKEQPLREITGPSTQLEDPHGIAVDSERKLIFVANYGNARQRDRSTAGRFEPASITVHSLEAKGDARPLRIIEGDKTQLNWPAGVAVNPRTGLLYVANDGGDSVLAFHVDDEGNVAPRQVIKGPKTNLKNPTGVAVDVEAGELWASCFGNHSAVVFPLDANGDVEPKRTIRAAPKGEQALGIGNPGAVAYDTKRQEILVPN